MNELPYTPCSPLLHMLFTLLLHFSFHFHTCRLTSLILWKFLETGFCIGHIFGRLLKIAGTRKVPACLILSEAPLPPRYHLIAFWMIPASLPWMGNFAWSPNHSWYFCGYWACLGIYLLFTFDYCRPNPLSSWDLSSKKFLLDISPHPWLRHWLKKLEKQISFLV